TSTKSGLSKDMGGPLEGCIVEPPVWRPQFPQQPAQRPAVRRQPGAAPLGVEIPLVPEAMLAIGCGRLTRPGDVLNVIAADRDQGRAAFRPQRGHDAGGATAPIIAGERSPLDIERIEKLQEVMAECGLLARPRRSRIEKPGRPVAAQIGYEHPQACGGE